MGEHSGIPFEEVARLPQPGAIAPVAPAFSADGRYLAYLFSEDASLTRQLFVVDLDTKETHRPGTPSAGVAEAELTLEEKLARERARDLGLGVTRFAWAKQGAALLVPLQDGLHLLDEPSGELRQVVSSAAGPIFDAKLSPDGTRVGFVQDDEVHVVAVTESVAPTAVTTGAAGTGRTHGLAEFIAQEEMARFSGWWWSPDGQWIAFCEVDETHIPVYRIVHQGSADVGEGAEEDHRYPFAGGPNANVRLGIVPSDGSGAASPRWLEFGDDAEYLARVDWAPDGTMLVQTTDRAQSRLVIQRIDPTSGVQSPVLVEDNPIWINLHDDLRQLTDGRLLWATEASGFKHLSIDGRPITSGSWMVDAVEAVDVDRGLVWFTGTLDGAVERHLYAVSMDGGVPERLTNEPGTHAVVIDVERRRFVDTWSALDQPPVVRVCSLDDGTVEWTLHDRRDPRIDQIGLAPPEPVTIVNRDGVTLYGMFHRPNGSGPWPTIVQVYGGPHAQIVTNSWAATASMRAQHLRSRGFAVFTLDNRGSARRGLAFEGAIRHDMGNLEVADQVDGVRWLVAQGVTDPNRVGIYGWSYGGYMAAMCLATAPDVFRAAVAGAPVTSWDGYDTHYTERYMGTPSDNEDGYRRSSVMAHVDGLRGRLLLVHGLIDENVHFRHTARLVNALIAARKEYDLLLFPDERHVPRNLEDRIYMEERIAAFFEDALQ